MYNPKPPLTQLQPSKYRYNHEKNQWFQSRRFQVRFPPLIALFVWNSSSETCFNCSSGKLLQRNVLLKLNTLFLFLHMYSKKTVITNGYPKEPYLKGDTFTCFKPSCLRYLCQILGGTPHGMFCVTFIQYEKPLGADVSAAGSGGV